MARTTATIPQDPTDLLDGAIEAGVFENESDAIRHAIREYFDENQQAKTAAAVALYEQREVTLGTAARLAGVNRFDMKEIIQEEGVELRIGPETVEQAQEEIENARDLG